MRRTALLIALCFYFLSGVSQQGDSSKKNAKGNETPSPANTSGTVQLAGREKNVVVQKITLTGEDHKIIVADTSGINSSHKNIPESH